MATYYKCDPRKNTVCKKKACIINGGPCDATCYRKFAAEPLQVIERLHMTAHERRKEGEV